MYRIIILITALTAPFSFANDSDTDNSNAKNTAMAREVIDVFSKDLKQILVSTMKAQGPVAAINVCSISAPAIASQHSQTPITISRSSLKVRNSGNTPEAWLKQVLTEFEQRKDNGEPITQIEHSEQRPDGWYFVKAIPTGEPCLACHGNNIKPAVQEKLAELYPNDQATGFNIGDIRGAFIVKKATTKPH